jgi:hypothetical protein
MVRTLALSVSTLALAFALPVAAGEEAPQMSPEEQAMMEAYQKAGTPGPAHERMAKMAGNYEMTVKSWSAPGAKPTTDAGKATRKMLLDGRVLLEEVQSSMNGQPFHGMGLHGFDNVTGKHWSTWNDSMMTGLMVSEGACDEKDNCTYTGSWNDPVSKGKFTVRMTSTWSDANTEVFSMYAPGPDGKEFQMMEITYVRKP